MQSSTTSAPSGSLLSDAIVELHLGPCMPDEAQLGSVQPQAFFVQIQRNRLVGVILPLGSMRTHSSVLKVCLVNWVPSAAFLFMNGTCLQGGAERCSAGGFQDSFRPCGFGDCKTLLNIWVTRAAKNKAGKPVGTQQRIQWMMSLVSLVFPEQVT